MATDIVQSLFGPSPYDIQRAQRAEMDNTAWKYAKAAPFEAARAGLFSAAGGLAGAGAEALGMVNPQVEQARATEQAMAGIDPSNPDAIFQRAQQVQDPRLKMRLTQYAQQMKAQQQEMATKKAMELVQLHKAQSEASPLAKIPYEKATPASRAIYARTKNIADLEFNDAEGKISDQIEQYEYAKTPAGGNYKGTFEQFKTLGPAIAAAAMAPLRFAQTSNINDENAYNLPPKSPAIRAPAIGKVDGGYRFKGGNPADKRNWEKL